MEEGPKLSGINFFISSTYVDMREYRDAVIKNLQSRAAVINAQEFFGARDKKPLQTCLDELTQSNVFIMFVGPRYGSIDEGSGTSFVEREYDYACELKIPKFAYIIDENQPFPLKFVSKGDEAKLLENFRARVQSELTISTFTTPDDLAAKVYSDLRRELPKQGFVIGQEAPDKEQAFTQRILEQFFLLPKLYHGHKVTFTARLRKNMRASAKECEAFGYDFGATLKRTFEAADPLVGRALRSSSSIFAQGDLAETLMNIPLNKEICLTVKTVQGEYVEREPVYALEREVGVFDSIAASFSERRRVITDFEETTQLLCGLEYLSFREV